MNDMSAMDKCPNAADRDMAGICTVGPVFCQGCVESAKQVADGMFAYRDEKVKRLKLQIEELEKKLGSILKGVCKECSGSGEIGLSDGEVPCPTCGGSGDVMHPGIFSLKRKDEAV